MMTHVFNRAEVELLLQLDQVVDPINITRMNHRLVPFLIVCNGTSADSLMAPDSIGFSHYPTAAALFNHYI